MVRALADPTLDAEERDLVSRVAARREDLVALACELIGHRHDEPLVHRRVRRASEAALQQALADRLAAHGAEIDLWEPAPEDVAGHPLSIDGIGFAGRPQLAARLRGTRRRPLAAAQRPHRRRARRPRGRLGARSVRSAGREWHDRRPRRVRHEGRDRGDGDRRRGARRDAAPSRGDLVVCTNTDEESSGVGGLACARHGVSADYAIVTEPSSLEVWPACRGTVYCTVTIRGPRRARRAGAPALARRRRGQRDRQGRASCSTASTACAREWRTRVRPPPPPARPARHRSPRASSPTPAGT